MAKAKETVETKKETKKNVHEVVIKIEGEEWSKALDTAFAKRQKTAKTELNTGQKQKSKTYILNTYTE